MDYRTISLKYNHKVRPMQLSRGGVFWFKQFRARDAAVQGLRPNRLC